jgi:hypothetical protein
MASDQVVNAKDVLQALMEVRRVGGRRMLEDLERREPDLTEFCLEELSAIHQQLLEMRATPRQVRDASRRVEGLALVLVTALRKAGLRLWREQAATGRLVQIDPSLAAGPHAAPGEPPTPARPGDETEAGDAGVE